MALSVDVMVWDPDAVGCRDDSFKGGGWDPFGYGVDVDQIDGDYVELIVRTGETQGYIEKYGISVNAATYKYLVLGLWGDGDYFVQVYDGVWKMAKAMGDAPDTYDIVVVDLSGVTTGTVTGIRLGVGSSAGKKVTYDFVEFHSEQPDEPTDISSTRVLQREGETDSFESEWIEGASDPFTKGHLIRIIVARDTNKEKIFAGVIEESNLKTGGLREVGGRCFQVKLQAATKSKSFDDRELSLAVKDIVEDFEEISTGRVKTPSPTINIRKDYVDAHIVDILDQLASLPSKQSPYEAWRHKLGYGQDLRFHSENDADVPTSSTSIAEGTNLLVGVKKGSDIYELYNKVKAISGEVEYPVGSEWTDDHTEWSIEFQMGCTGCELLDGTSEGHPYIMIACDLLGYIRIGRSITSIDLTQFKGIHIWIHRNEGEAGDHPYITLMFGSDADNCWEKSVSTPRKMEWFYIESQDFKYWTQVGSPDITNVTWIGYRIGWGGVIGNIMISDWRFYADNIEATASDPASVVDHDRVYVHKDAKINQIGKLQDLADGLLHAMKAAANRVMLPVVGAPDLQRGRKVQVTSASFGLSGTYPILEAEHILGREVGYLTVVMIQKGRYALPADLRRTLERELRLEKLGTVTIL